MRPLVPRDMELAIHVPAHPLTYAWKARPGRDGAAPVQGGLNPPPWITPLQGGSLLGASTELSKRCVTREDTEKGGSDNPGTSCLGL